MENITEKLNSVIDYIEKHLTDDIDQGEIARIACRSYYDVGRMFSLIADVSISDYIRKRRLTLAGIDLKYGGAKVIDTALKYRYDSPVSFARAFQSFHGFAPSDACKDDAVLNAFPRLLYQIQAKEVVDMIRKDIITVNGKDYEASYYGETDMSAWSTEFSKRQYWRLDNTSFEDLKCPTTLNRVLPYNNYPPINIELGQIFVMDYHRKNGDVERRYYVADGTVWQDMSCTREFILDYLQPIRTDTIKIGNKDYEASYFGDQDMSSWSEYATRREFWRLENVGYDFNDCENRHEVLPYNNYPPIKIEVGQVFVVDYHKRDGTTDRLYYIADGTVWQGMESTRQFVVADDR